MRKTKFLRKAVVPILTVCTAATVPLVSFAETTAAEQDDWDLRFSAIQSMTDSIYSSEKTPQQTNQVVSAPENVTVKPGNSMAGSIIYRDQNGNILDTVDASKASEYEKLYRKTSTSSSSSMSTTSKTYSGSSSSSSSSSGSSSTSSSSSKNSVYEKGGPGSSNVTDTTDSSQNFSGPTVQDVSLSETYYEDYDIYAISIQDQYFFYSTIGNNGITNKTVTVDIPANVTYSMTKDGMPMDYVSKQPLSETGTYVFKITVVQNPGDSVSRQNIIRANYHFRIQPKVEKPKETESQSSATVSGSQYMDSYAPDNYIGNLLPNDPTQNTQSSQTESETQADSQMNSFGNLDYSDFDSLYDYGSSALDGSSEEETTGQDLTGEDQLLTEDGETSGTGLERSDGKTVYSHDLNMYKVLSGAGGTLYATLPNGMLTNYGVELNTDKVSGTVTLIRDGEETTLPEDGKVSDPGSYEVLLAGNTEGYSFRILGDAVNDLEYYTLPEDVTLTELYLDDQLLSPNSYTDANGVQRIHFKEDGEYRMIMKNNLGAGFETDVTCDRTAPVVQVTENRGSVSISYGNAAEVARVVLHSKKTEETLDVVREVTKPGNYTMDVYDRAGNCTTVRFRVKSSMNAAAIVSVVLLVLIMGAFAFLFIRTKRDAKVS